MPIAPKTPAPIPSRARNDRRAIKDCSHFPLMRVFSIFHSCGSSPSSAFVGILTQRYNRVLIEQDGLKGTKLSAGLSTAESQERLRQHGPNRVEEERRHPLLTFLGKFWAPVPWMLEATIALGILVHKLDEAVIIGCLLLFNSVLSSVQENQANRALDLLRSRLSV
jgi:magnesium-transporting ATPase (P-type)